MQRAYIHLEIISSPSHKASPDHIELSGVHSEYSHIQTRPSSLLTGLISFKMTFKVVLAIVSCKLSLVADRKNRIREYMAGLLILSVTNVEIDRSRRNLMFVGRPHLTPVGSSSALPSVP
jgi:hypothetical protein